MNKVRDIIGNIVQTAIIDIATIKKYFDKNQSNLAKNFSEDSWFANQENCDKAIIMITYYRRNLHRFAKDYLGLNLHIYQQIILYLMGRSSFIVMIASRASAKSYVIAIYACCKCILYPKSIVVLTSGVKNQAKLIVTKKIEAQLMKDSPRLCQEITKVNASQVEAVVNFGNGSQIVTVTLSPNALGNRSTDNVGEEAARINKKTMDKVISPMKFVRQSSFRALPEYDGVEELKEEAKEIYISSSIEETHWLYESAKKARDSMLRGGDSFFIAFDYSISLRHGIKSKKDLALEKSKVDPITWAIEYENAVLRSNSKAFFTYDMIKECQTLKRAFYPRKNEDVINKKPNEYAIPKQKGEIRIVVADIAMIDRANNDNSSFSCLRLIPESIPTFNGKTQRRYRIQLPYIEAIRGCEAQKQAVRIRQLDADFEADYIVLDVKGVGVSVYDALARTLYDEDRCVEYAPLKSMNDDTYAARGANTEAEAKIYCMNATLKLNSDIATNLKTLLLEQRLDLLISKDDGINELIKFSNEYRKALDPDTKLFYETPYLQTMAFFAEAINLEYEKTELGLIKIREKGSATKDRYTSVSYGCWFATMLERDLLSEEEEIGFDDASTCVSNITF